MAHRKFRDALGREWEAWDVTPDFLERRDDASPPLDASEGRRRRYQFRERVAAEWAKGWLAFETKGERRRLAPIPPEWIRTSEANLARLCDTATPVRFRWRVLE